MADRYADWHRQRNYDGTTSAQQAQGRKVLGLLMEELQLAGLPTGVKRWEAPDGTVYTASFDGTTPTIQIETVGGTKQPPPLPPIDLWIPQGFVFTPGNDVSPAGFGLPVQFTQAAPDDAFDPGNTNPGLDVQRWKAGGPCGQVLLTRQDTTDYPRGKKRRIPVGFDRQEWRAGAYTAPAFSAWHAVRPRFNDFSWSPATMGARRDVWRALEAAQGKPVSLPFAGYYDDAQLIADLGTGYGTTPAAWPLAAYRTETQRATADGVPVAYDEAWTNGTVAELTADLGTFHDGVPALDAGVQAGLKVATLRTQDAWIHAGNQFWHPSDPSLPTLSWDGYPAQNLPFWLVAGGWTGGVGSAVFPLEGWHYEWRGQTRYVYSKKLYAMGRIIGVLPATVISAAIRTETVPIDGAPGRSKRVNRVVVITWDAADQFGDATGIAYLWKFRVWCADFDVAPGVPLHLTAVPVGAYDGATNPTGWRACGSFTGPGRDPNNHGPLSTQLQMRSPWQMWRFDGDGSRALAAYGLPPFAPSSARWVAELVFQTVGADALQVTRVDYAALSYGQVCAADYGAAGGVRYVSTQRLPDPANPFGPMVSPDGTPIVDGAYGDVVRWSGGGSSEPRSGGDSNANFWQASDLFVLDARDGVMALLDYWPVCSTAHAFHYDVRLCRGGQRVDVSWFLDTSLAMVEGQRDSENFLDRLNPSCARDRAGNWMLGYDLGATAGTGEMYVTVPICNTAKPAVGPVPYSRHFGSRWISNTGDPQAMAQVNGAMRAFPLGVC